MVGVGGGGVSGGGEWDGHRHPEIDYIKIQKPLAELR